MKNHVRTVKFSLERHLGVAIPNDHNLLTWVVHYASMTYNKFHIGADGRTPRERIIGRKIGPAMAKFGESVWWKPLISRGRAPPLDERFRLGFFVSYVSGSNQGIVLTPDGAVRCRCIKRRPRPDQWSGDILDCNASGAPAK